MVLLLLTLSVPHWSASAYDIKVVAVFLQFFSWGLITAPMITMLNTTFGVSNNYN